MTPYNNIAEYYNVLLRIDININTLEVFNALVQSTQLPKEYILCFIKNCFNRCEK